MICNMKIVRLFRGYMNKILLSFFVVGFVFCVQSNANAVRRIRSAGACSSVVGIGGYIYKNYQPLRRGDHTLIGYIASPTLLDNGGGSSRGGATIYDTKGVSLASCQGLPCDECKNHWRFKCSAATPSIRRSAVRNTRSPSVLFKVGGKCVQVPDAGRCYGSVKGLCNRTLI